MIPPQYAIYIYLAPIVAIVSIFMALVAWKTRRAPGSNFLLVLIFTTSAWLIINTLELAAPTPAATLFFARLTYLPVAALAPLWLSFALLHSGQRKWLALPGYAMLWVIPALIVALIWTNNSHQLIWRSWTFLPMNGILPFWVLAYGPFFWVHTLYSYCLLLIGSAVLIGRYLKSFHLYRKQSFWLVLAALCPTIFNAIYILHLVPGWTMDYTPLGFALAGLALMQSIFRYQLFDVNPVPRDLVMDYISDGILVLDRRDRIVDINRAARWIMGDANGEVVGKRVEDCLPGWNEMVKRLKAIESQTEDLAIEGPDGVRHFDVRISQFTNNRRDYAGRLVILQDITERQRLMRELEDQARTDPLISMFNRRHFFDLARREFERSRRGGKQLSIIMIDVDLFKTINDTYGHPAGDFVLQQIAGRCQSVLRIEDILARYGGEEFIILLPETCPEHAEGVAERLRLEVQDAPIEVCGEKTRVTISLGVAGVKVERGSSLDDLLTLADSALYCSKNLGRNRVTLCVQKNDQKT